MKCRNPDCGKETTLEVLFKNTVSILLNGAGNFQLGGVNCSRVVFQSNPYYLNDACPGCKKPYSAGAVSNQMTVAIRRHIKEYYMVTKFSLSRRPVEFFVTTPMQG